MSVLSISACSGDSSSPTSPSTTGLNLAGNWTGTFTEAGGQSGPPLGFTWAATQSGANVSGPLVITVEDGDNGGTFKVNATLSGTVSGAQLTSTRFTVAAGSIPDELSTCSISGTGTLAATAASLSGPMAMVFAPAGLPCVGEDAGVSNTPTGTWTFSLTK